MDKEVILSREKIANRVQVLGLEISEVYAGKKILAIGVLKGAFVFMADLVRAIEVPVEVDFIQVSSYGVAQESTNEIKLLKDCANIAGADVLLIEDIVDTGLTMAWLKEHFVSLGAASVKVCTLIDKLERRKCVVGIDFVGFPLDDGFVVGYGMDCNEEGRCLADICKLHSLNL